MLILIALLFHHHAAAAASWDPLGLLPAAVAYHAVVPVCDLNGLLVIGGNNASGTVGDLSDVRFYNITENVWTKFPSMLKPRSSMAAARLGTIVLVCGGENEQSSGAMGDDTCESLDLSLPTSQQQWVSAPSLPLPRTSAGLIALPDGSGFILVGGFMTPPITYFDTTLFLPISGTAWLDLGVGAKLPFGGRSNFGLAVAGGLIFQVGGSGLNPSYADLSIFNVETKAWLAVTPIPAPRSWMSIATVKASGQETILIIGGEDEGFNIMSSVIRSSVINASSADTLSWTDAPSLPFPRSFSKAGACGDVVFEIGGVGPMAGVNNSFFSLLLTSANI